MTHITRSYGSFDAAAHVVARLKDAGFRDDTISLVARSGEADPTDKTSALGDDATLGATSLGVFGAGTGLLAGLGVLAIPGLGPVVAAGWLAAAATGAVAGAVAGGVAGGIVGALAERGVPEGDAHMFAESLNQGGAIVSVYVDDAEIGRAEDIFGEMPNAGADGAATAYRHPDWDGSEHDAKHFPPI